MSRFLRLAISLSSAVALLALVFVIAPNGAVGGERLEPRSGSGDRYFFGRTAEITSPVDGTVQVYGGKIDVDAPIAGDLLVFGGRVTLGDRGHVGGNLIYAGTEVEGAEGRVSGHTVSVATVQGAAATLTKSAVVASLLLVWFIVAVVLTLLAGREIRYSSVEVRASALHCFTLGLVGFTSFVITAIVCSYLVPFLIGVPLLAFLAVFAIVTKVYGMIAVFHAAGSLVARPRTREQLVARRWFRGDLAMVVIGLVILGAIRLIPFVGTIVWSCASVFGIGCALATKFGRREPAFLAWRPAEA
jgi:hypothetical protein